MENYRNKFKFLVEYNPSEGGQLLEEQLVPAKMNDLNIAMQQNEELKKLLTTPSKNLPERYKYLVDEITDYENYTLLDIIDNTLKYKRFIPYFSKMGNEMRGFVAYEVSKNEVSDIKLFSFDLSQAAVVLFRDLIILLDELVMKYKKVSWLALKANPANKIYQKAIEKYNGTMEEIGNELHYCIDNTNANQN